MLQTFSIFFNKLIGTKPKSTANTCCNGCKDVLHLVIDGEANDEEVKYLHEHIEECAPCFNHYKIDKSVKEVLKHKMEHRPVPSDLIKNIRQQLGKEEA